jgi:hypothetical protein
MSFSHFFRTASTTIAGAASVRLLTDTQVTLSSGPIQKAFTASKLLLSRQLHTEVLAPPKPKVQHYAAIGGGIAALANIERFAEDFYTRYRKYPTVIFCSDEGNHWLNRIHPDFYGRRWGQPKEALIKPFQSICTQLFPHVGSKDYPTLQQIQRIRQEYIKRTCLTYGIVFMDSHVEKINEDTQLKSIDFMSKKGKVITTFSTDDVKLYNFSTQFRDTTNPVLSLASREGGLLYSEKKSDDPVCMIGGGLSTVWAAEDRDGPMIVLRKRQFPMNVKVPTSRVGFSELIEEESDISIKGNTVVVEGVDIKSQETVRMRFEKSSCFLSLGTFFNKELTKNLNPAVVTDIDPFSQPGNKASQIAGKSINPGGGLVHRYAVSAHLLGRYPIEDGTNVARYVNLWSSHVTMELAKKMIILDRAYFEMVEPHISKLFLEKHVPTKAELEKILRTVYESLPSGTDQPLWSQIKDVLVPITHDFEHTLHPHLEKRSSNRPGLNS